MPNPNWPAVIPIPEETITFMSPDTTKTTRTDFTDFFQRFRPAEDAHPLYRHLFLTHQELAKALIEHPAMRPNLEQTFSTPANSKNKVYFMWDFVLRTFQILVAQVNPQNPYRSPTLGDIVGRATMARGLTLDTEGQLEAMNASVGYSDDAGVDFGEEIKRLAARLDELPEVCAACKKQREDGKPLLICARCKDEKYCSAECQKKRWKSHKKECKEGGIDIE
ncbi:hypothetical protein N0V83_005413 [Neocucurbitaria cava]|uniref:MYND-type domain-containing protein n=1 Tax=Neocucurbitaria cava TaxID=798079 RepID=A0A9W8Y7W0_9PLEO|nr:hypothetical protein N0V83_005413 [Neocucurbitaria cava]